VKDGKASSEVMKLERAKWNARVSDFRVPETTDYLYILYWTELTVVHSFDSLL
jgi:hypothetical protein